MAAPSFGSAGLFLELNDHQNCAGFVEQLRIECSAEIAIKESTGSERDMRGGLSGVSSVCVFHEYHSILP